MMTKQSNIDLTRARSETPGCERVLHFNNAGAALMPQKVLDAVVEHLELEAAMGGYEAAARAKDKWENTYAALASLINCDRKEIAVIENATRAWDMAFYAIPFQKGDRILTAMSEYASNYIAYLQIARKTGAAVEIIPNDESGQVSPEALRAMLDKRVKIISITHVPTNGGLVNPAAEIGKIAKTAGVLYLLDACQSIGQMPIDVREIGCDMLSASGRKYLRGPRGTGFLYVRRAVLEGLEPPFLDLHAARWSKKDRYTIRPDARRFENWETNYAGKIGLGAAVDYALDWGLGGIWERIKDLAQTLRERLQAIPGVTAHDLGRERCGIITLTKAGKTVKDIYNVLQQQRINVSVTDVFSTRLDMESRSLSSLIRASVHYYNSEDEIDRFAEALDMI
jgi:selenocysteine lyase/cysteine desulfurase